MPNRISRAWDVLRGATPQFSIGDPAFAAWLAEQGLALPEVNGTSALGVTAYYRSVALIAGTIASLPLKTYRTVAERRERVRSFLDNPAGPYPLAPFAWKELVLVHLLTQGEAFLWHVRNEAGALIGLWPIQPSAVQVAWSGAEKRFTYSLADGTPETVGPESITHVMGLTVDGLRGVAPLTVMRQVIQLGLAMDRAAYRSVSTGALIRGMVTPNADISEEDAAAIKAGLDAKIAGPDNAGSVAVVNRALTFAAFTMTNDDAQFLESREFQVEEFARMFGIPPHLLGATEKQTSWGTGVAEQNLGLARYTLSGWTSRLEESLSRLLPSPRFVEFDYAGLLQGTPKEEIELLKVQVEAGILTIDEARAIRNYPPLGSPASEGGQTA